MFINNFNPVAFQLFSIDIRWYSLAYIIGILLGWLYCKRIIIKDKKISEEFDEFISYIIIGIILGGRLGYILFYNPIYYFKNPIEIFILWNGGMSFHGGILGILISSYFFSKKKNINKFIFLDLVAISAPIGIFFGRITNFINSELYGRPTEIFWSVKFINIDNINRHPSQIYEALFEGIVLFILLNIFLREKINKPGLISALFLIFYSFFRFFIEFTREPDAQIGLIFSYLTMGQIICLVFFLIGLILFFQKNETK